MAYQIQPEIISKLKGLPPEKKKHFKEKYERLMGQIKALMNEIDKKIESKNKK